MEFFSLTPDLSFSICFFPCFPHYFGKGGSFFLEKPAQNSHLGILALEAAPLLEVDMDQGVDGPLGSFCSCRARFGRSRSNPAPPSQEKGWIPSQQLVLRAPWKRSQDFSWMCFLVWLCSFSPSLPSLALVPAPMDA